jgi:RNA polymerase primary sigma factor
MTTKKFVSFESTNSISKYLKEVRKTPLLSPDEEVALAIRIQNGDTDAINELVNANLRFVIQIAKEYQNQGLPLDDLISDGNYGLIKAATRFDHTLGFRFISYAVWWIKQSIIQSLNDNARMVRLPASIINKISVLKKEIERFEFENEREPIFGEILDENNEPIELITNEIINEDGDEMIDTLTADDEEIFVVTDKIKDLLNKTLETLDERERNIIQCYYGINTGCEPMTLQVIGEIYNLTKERIRQIKVKALRKLRHNSDKLYELIRE